MKKHVSGKNLIKIRNRHFNVLKEVEAEQKVLHWFFSYPLKSIGLNDLAVAVSISKTTAKKIVEKFILIDFLKREILGKVWRISCNVDHPYNQTIKIPYNLSMIYQSGILEHVFEQVSNPRAVVLFGSYRKGDDTDESDIDIAVEIFGDEDVEITQTGVVSELGYRKNVPVNLHIFTRNKIDLNLFSNIANGIVLSGFLEVRI